MKAHLARNRQKRFLKSHHQIVNQGRECTQLLFIFNCCFSDSKINSARPLKRMPTIREDSHSAERLKLHKDGRFLKQKMEAEKYFKHFNDKMVKLQTITEYDLKFPLQVKQGKYY